MVQMSQLIMPRSHPLLWAETSRCQGANADSAGSRRTMEHLVNDLELARADGEDLGVFEHDNFMFRAYLMLPQVYKNASELAGAEAQYEKGLGVLERMEAKRDLGQIGTGHARTTRSAQHAHSVTARLYRRRHRPAAAPTSPTAAAFATANPPPASNRLGRVHPSRSTRHSAPSAHWLSARPQGHGRLLWPSAHHDPGLPRDERLDGGADRANERSRVPQLEAAEVGDHG